MYFQWKPYVSVAERRKKAERAAARYQKKTGLRLSPVTAAPEPRAKGALTKKKAPAKKQTPKKTTPAKKKAPARKKKAVTRKAAIGAPMRVSPAPMRKRKSG